MIKKIIFLSGIPVSKIVGNKFGVLWFKNNGYDVHLWDLTKIFWHKSSINHYFSGNDDFKFNFENTLEILNKKDFIENLKILKKNSIICFLSFHTHNDFWILRLLKKYNVNYYVGPRMPIYKINNLKKGKKDLIQKITKGENLIKLLSYRFYINKINELLFQYTSYFKKPIFVASAGKVGKIEELKRSSAGSFVSVLSTDIIWEKPNKLCNYKYGVFIDDTVLFSPDMGLNNKYPHGICLNSDGYLKNMCKIFDLIEKEYSLKIIISASGKYKYRNKNVYGDRQIIYERTHDLLSFSEIAIGHTSTAIFQTLLYPQLLLLLKDENIVERKNKGVDMLGNFLNIKVQDTKLFSLKDLEKSKINKKDAEFILDNFFYDKDLCNLHKSHHQVISEKINSIKF